MIATTVEPQTNGHRRKLTPFKKDEKLICCHCNGGIILSTPRSFVPNHVEKVYIGTMVQGLVTKMPTMVTNLFILNRDAAPMPRTVWSPKKRRHADKNTQCKRERDLPWRILGSDYFPKLVTQCQSAGILLLSRQLPCPICQW